MPEKKVSYVVGTVVVFALLNFAIAMAEAKKVPEEDRAKKFAAVFIAATLLEFLIAAFCIWFLNADTWTVFMFGGTLLSGIFELFGAALKMFG